MIKSTPHFDVVPDLVSHSSDCAGPVGPVHHRLRALCGRRYIARFSNFLPDPALQKQGSPPFPKPPLVAFSFRFASVIFPCLCVYYCKALRGAAWLYPPVNGIMMKQFLFACFFVLVAWRMGGWYIRLICGVYLFSICMWRAGDAALYAWMDVYAFHGACLGHHLCHDIT